MAKHVSSTDENRSQTSLAIATWPSLSANTHFYKTLQSYITVSELTLILLVFEK